MENFNVGDVREIIQGRRDFGDWAGDYLVKSLYSELCGEYLRRGGTQDGRIESCTELYEIMFQLTLCMNRLCPIYDDGFIAHIAREAMAINSEAWKGVSERELRDTLRHRLKRCTENGASKAKGFAIDCHVHTSDGSGCARDNGRKMIESAKSNGLNGMIITEHNKLTPQYVIDELNAAYAPFRVFSGIEIRIQGDDFLVLGLHDEILQQKWEYIELFNYVRENGGYIALAHPHRYWNGVDSNVYSFRPDALEIYSTNMDNISWQQRQNALRLANSLQVNILANSDAHATDAFRYCNVLEREPADEGELVWMLKEGAYRLGRVPILY
ncbi:MAG: PHP domain-containing protein [Clostridiales bacterium]|nr:PHP domain-containing protein [Clostridiales bacterium]